MFRFTKSSNCEILFVVSVLRFFSFVSAMFNVQLCAESALLCSARFARRQRKLNYVCFVAAAAAAAATAVAAGVAAETRRQSVSNAGCRQRRAQALRESESQSTTRTKGRERANKREQGLLSKLRETRGRRRGSVAQRENSVPAEG